MATLPYRHHWILALFICLLGCTLSVQAQQYALKHFTVEDGLPSSNLYDVVQDKDGFLWIATEGGMAKYDGHEFLKSPIKEVEKDAIVNLYVDSNNQLWMIDLSTRISAYKDGAFRRVVDLDDEKQYQHVQLYEDNNGNIWFANQEGLSVEIELGSGMERKRLTYGSKNVTGEKVFAEVNDSLLYVLSRTGLSTFENYRYRFQPFEKPLSGTLGHTLVVGDSILFSMDNRIVLLDSLSPTGYVPVFENLEPYLESGIVDLYLDRARNIWISTHNGVLRLKAQGQGDYSLTQLLRGVIGGEILQDIEGNYWFGTFNDGLYCLPSLEVKVQERNRAISALHPIPGVPVEQVLIATDYHKLRLRSADMRRTLARHSFPRNHRIYALESDSEGDLYAFTALGMFRFDDELDELERMRGASFKTGDIDEEGRIWFGGSSTAGYVQGDTLVRALNRRSYSILPSAKKTWIGAIDGLYEMVGDSVQLVEVEELQTDVRDLALDWEGNLWIATQGNGIYVLNDADKQILHHFTSEEGMISNICRRVLITNRYAYIATNKGVNRIALRDSLIETITTDEGLPSNEINDLALVNKDVWVATNKGIGIFYENMPLYDQSPKLNVTRIRINEQDTLVHPEYELSYQQNNIKIEFVATGFRHADEMQYQYRMDGVDEQWVTTQFQVAQYPALLPGSYTFRLRTRSVNSKWSEEKQYDFVIHKAFWQTFWFRFLVTCLFLLLGGVFIYLVFQGIQRRNQVRNKLTASRLTALRAQMNPHFLFNSLNSIQDFIITNDKRKANRYLSQFSKLMRNILNFSEKDEISLRKETESLKIYLDLEALRFEENFEYQIDVANEVDLDQTFVPPMLIQPYVENAIKHGLMHRKGILRTLDLKIYEQKRYLVVEVIDNGIGRKRSREIQLQNRRLYPSVAMSLTQERLELLNAGREEDLGVEIEDLYHPNGQAAGTKVTLYIPLLKKEVVEPMASRAEV